MKNQRGQASVEMVIMLVVMMGIVFTVSSAFKQNELFAKLVSGPWIQLAGLIQNGSWGSPENTMAKHPNSESRVNTVRGDPIQ